MNSGCSVGRLVCLDGKDEIFAPDHLVRVIPEALNAALAFDRDHPVWITMRDEIVELVGEEPYERFVDYVQSREPGTILPHPQVRRRSEG